MSLLDAQIEFNMHIHSLKTYILSRGYRYKTTWALRDMELQKRMVATGASRTLNSMHLNNLAEDIIIIRLHDHSIVSDPAELKRFGDYWESLSPKNRWGGNFKGFYDGNHYERVW